MYHSFFSSYIKSAACSGGGFLIALSYFSHFWLATPQLVLQADWQEVWHSPQPPFLALSHRLRVSRVLILSMIHISILCDLVYLRLCFTQPNYRKNFITGCT
jgi:hypothetical protein